MRKITIFIFSIIISFVLYLSLFNVEAKSYMSDKTEVEVNLEISGAEALCQTDDGYVWIAQYAGLTRYDAKEYVTYKEFEEDGEKYDIINVRALQTKDNVLYIATDQYLFIYKDNQFKKASVDVENIRDIILDQTSDTIYISTNKGVVLYFIDSDSSFIYSGTDGLSISRVALDDNSTNFFYQRDDGVYDNSGNLICSYTNKITELYSYGTYLYIGLNNGDIYTYDIKNQKELTKVYKLGSQINKILYSDEEKALFAATDKKSLYFINLKTNETHVVGNLKNNLQLTDLMFDYEGNLWVTSHNTTASGVSIITQNPLLELLYDDEKWQALDNKEGTKNVYAVERYDKYLYIITLNEIFIYDLEQAKIIQENPIMDKIKEYAESASVSAYPMDVEVYKDKIYFAVSNVGLVVLEPSTNEVTIYNTDYIKNHVDDTGDPYPSKSPTATVRCLRTVGDYLICGYNEGLVRYDGDLFKIKQGYKVLYINQSPEGHIMFNSSGAVKGIFEINDDFTKITEIPTANGVSGTILKFLAVGDKVYYNFNSRLFRTYKKDGQQVIEEILVPYVKGSIVELSRIKYTDKYGVEKYKYIIGSQTQIYITSSLDDDNLDNADGNRLLNYEFYDSTNGLQQLPANTSGYYDSISQKYYFQSTDGVFVYDFNELKGNATPVKIAIDSVDIDGVHQYGDTFNVSKNTYRISFNLSILGFRPNKGYTVYYKLDGVDDNYHIATGVTRNIYYTNLSGGQYRFHVYVVDEYGQKSNQVDVLLIKEKYTYEQAWFWVLISLVTIGFAVGLNFFIIKIKTRASLKRQLEYKNITVESIQAIARTIDAKDEYTNGHSIRVGYYSKLIAQNLNMKEDDVDNIYYIALLHDIGKIAIPDSILNKPGRLTDEEFAVMKSHTTRGAKILKGISTIPQIVEGAKSHHEKYDGTGYPEGLKGEEIPYVARIICCADCFDAMASKRVYKEPFSLEKIISEFERCSGTQFDPHMAKLVVEMIKQGKLKPYTAENTYLGSDGKTYRMKKEDVVEE